MGLEDKFENRSLIEKIDDYFLDVHSNIAKKWQDKTYKSKDEFASYLYLVSGTNFLTDYFISNFQDKPVSIPYLFSSMAVFYFSFSDKSRIKSNLQEEFLSKEFFGSKNIMKYFNIFSYSMGILSSISGLNHCALGYFYNNPENLLESVFDLSFSLAISSFTSANYISKADIEDPPKKPKKEKVYEKIYNFFRTLVPKKVYG